MKQIFTGNALSQAQPSKPNSFAYAYKAGRKTLLSHHHKTIKTQTFIPKKCKTLRDAECPGSLLVLKARVQNEGKQNQVIQASSCTLGHTQMPDRTWQ